MTFWEETRRAARGCLAILRGERDAAEYFDLTLRGLIAPVIALLVVIGLIMQLMAISQAQVGGPSPMAVLLAMILLAALSVVVLFYFLKFAGYGDRLVPFLVVIYWGNFYAILLLLVLSMIGLAGYLFLFGLVLVSIYFFVRTAQLIIGLNALMIVMLLVTQLAAGWVANAAMEVLLPSG